MYDVVMAMFYRAIKHSLCAGGQHGSYSRACALQQQLQLTQRLQPAANTHGTASESSRLLKLPQDAPHKPL